MFIKEFISILCCPDDRGDLAPKGNILNCKVCKRSFPIKDDIPILLPNSMANDVKLSLEKWDDEYKKTVNKEEMRNLKKNFHNTYLQSNMSYMNKLFKSLSGKKYLEIGCGPFFIGQEISKNVSLVVGIDYSINALRLAKFYLDEAKVKNYFLVCGDISNMPFKDNTFDILYGGGVIEHFKDTVGVVRENHRVLKKGGVAFNTVPFLNLGAITYRQVWGNIPNAPVLRELAEFVHIKLLKGRRMIYGYEYSFTKGQLRKIFVKAGFNKNNVEVDKLQVPLLFEYLKIKPIKKIAEIVATKTELFWPGLYILSKK